MLLFFLGLWVSMLKFGDTAIFFGAGIRLF